MKMKKKEKTLQQILKDLKEMAIKNICEVIKVKPKTLCDFGQLGLVSVKELAEVFYNGGVIDPTWVFRKFYFRIGEELPE